jgi:hypothetical protein
MAGGVYWIGQDGNVYYGSGAPGAGVVNYGSASSYTPVQGGLNASNPAGNKMAQSVADGAGILLGTQIADPLAGGGSSAPGNPTGATHPALDTAAIGNTQASIDQIPGILQAALASEDNNFGNVNSGFDVQQGQQQGTYDKSTVTNQQNYDSNFMDAIRAGIKGLHGLYQILRGTGAEGGTAQDQVQQIVGDTTSGDIRTGADTRDQNQGQLDSSLASFLTDLKGKRQAAADTHTNNAAAIRRDSNTNLQDLYSKMAGFYGNAGDTANANNWMSKAGSLTPAIASDSKAVTSRYDTTPVVIHAPNLTSFAAPSQPAVATAPEDGNVGAGIFTLKPSDTKKADQTQVPSLAGA